LEQCVCSMSKRSLLVAVNDAAACCHRISIALSTWAPYMVRPLLKFAEKPYIHTNMFPTNTHARKYAYIHAYIHVYIHVNMYMYICMHAYTHTHIHAYIHACVDMYTCIHTHTHKQIQQTRIHEHIHICGGRTSLMPNYFVVSNSPNQ